MENPEFEFSFRVEGLTRELAEILMDTITQQVSLAGGTLAGGFWEKNADWTFSIGTIEEAQDGEENAD